MSRPDKDAYLARYKGQRRRRLQVPEDGIKTKEQLIEYINKCEVMVDTIIVFEQIRDQEEHVYFRGKAQELYNEVKNELFKTGDLVDEDKMMEPFKQKLIKLIQDSDFGEEKKEEVRQENSIFDIYGGDYELPENYVEEDCEVTYLHSMKSEEEAIDFIKNKIIPFDSEYKFFIIRKSNTLSNKNDIVEIDNNDKILKVNDLKEENFGIDMITDIAKSNIELGKTVLGLNEDASSNKYTFTYYLNSAAAERRPSTKSSIKKDWKVEKRNYPLDVEAFEYAYLELLDNDEDDLNDLYEDLNDPDDDLEKVNALKEYFEDQDIGSGETIIISIEGPGQTYDSGYSLEDFLGELDESKKITENVNWSYFNKFKEITNKYLSDEGEGETLASQIVTAINKLVYKWYNDGDVYDNVNSGMRGWANDLSSYANWLDKYCDRAARILDSIYACSDDDTYEGILKALADKCLNPEYLVTLENEPKQGSIYDCDGQYEFSEYNEEDEYDEYDENLSLEDATVKTLSENFDEDEMDMYDLVENMINKLNEISEEDGLYWEANEVYDNCAITEDETDQYMEIFVYKDKNGNIKYSTDEEHADSYDTVEDAYEACTWKSND